MKSMSDLGGAYLATVQERRKKSRVTREFQEIGLMVAEILCDGPHKALYIKLAKELGKEKILSLAKSVAERREVSNRGAYFMWMLAQERRKKARKQKVERVKKMEILTIDKKENEAFLRKKTIPFDFAKFSKQEILSLIRDMRAAMRAVKGVGLSANQVGKNFRMFIAVVQRKSYAVFNPEIIKPSSTTAELEEGCLSIPKTYGIVARSESLELRGFDRYGKPLRIIASGLLARVFQHEVDHLDGKLFIDKAKDVHRVEDLNQNYHISRS